jgi:hypothetical protein
MPKRGEQKYIDELISALEATTKLITSLVNDMQENSELVIQLKEKIQIIESQIILLETILRGGATSDSLLTRFALLEKEVESVLEKISNIQKEEKIEDAQHDKLMTERMKIIIGGAVALISSIITAIATYYFK